MYSGHISSPPLSLLSTSHKLLATQGTLLHCLLGRTSLGWLLLVCYMPISVNEPAKNILLIVVNSRTTDANPYIPNGWGAQYYGTSFHLLSIDLFQQFVHTVNQNNFFRSVRNIHIDLRSVPAKVEATGLHWQVSQATSLQNVVVDMSTEPGTQHRGMYTFFQPVGDVMIALTLACG